MDAVIGKTGRERKFADWMAEEEGTALPSEGILEPDGELLAMCQALRNHVETINQSPVITLRGAVFKSREIDIQTAQLGPWEVGYRVSEVPLAIDGTMQREIWLKVHGATLDEVSDRERAKVVTALFEAFLDQGGGEPTIEPVADDCLKITQQFMVMMWVERNPGLVVPQ